MATQFGHCMVMEYLDRHTTPGLYLKIVTITTLNCKPSEFLHRHTILRLKYVHLSMANTRLAINEPLMLSLVSLKSHAIHVHQSICTVFFDKTNNAFTQQGTTKKHHSPTVCWPKITALSTRPA